MKTLLLAILFTIPAFAVETAPAEKKAPIEGKAPVEETAIPAPKLEPYELKNRSSFSLNHEARAPFWPIGWVKSKSGATNQPRVTSGGVLVAKKKFDIQPQHFSVTSVLLGHPALATINGRSFAEGEVLPVIAGNERLHVVLKAVRDGGVWLENGATQIYVPIRRYEVEATRPAEQQPLSSEFSIQIGAATETQKEVPKEAPKP